MGKNHDRDKEHLDRLMDADDDARQRMAERLAKTNPSTTKEAKAITENLRKNFGRVIRSGNS